MIFDDSSKAGKLLSKPSGEPASFHRAVGTTKVQSQKFIIQSRNFSRQYAHIYAERLLTTRGQVSETAAKKWGLPVRKLFEIKSDEKCIVVGTMYKHMTLKPSILREVSEEHYLENVPPSGRYTDESDKLILEDELQRIVLIGNIDVHKIATGVVIAVRGHEPEEDRGKFFVEEYCFQDLPPQLPLPSISEDKYICLVSGLDLGSSSDDLLRLQMMVDLLTGQLGDEGQQEASSKVIQVLIAGNILSKKTQDKENLMKAKYLTKKAVAGTVEAVKQVDDFLVQLAACVDVTVMPGEFDPTNFTLPQQPLHKCMFPQTNVYSTLRMVTNPYECDVEGVRLLGTSGQPVQDIYKFSQLDDRLEILENTLRWGHLAPTAPDTIGCYPYHADEPFIIKETPHIYFSGNQPQFQSKVIIGDQGQKVLLVTVPSFSKTGTCVLVNLKNLHCEPLVFQASFPQDDSKSSPDVDK